MFIKSISLLSHLSPLHFFVDPIFFIIIFFIFYYFCFCQDCPRLVLLRSRWSLISTPCLPRRGPPAWPSHTTRCPCWQEWDQVSPDMKPNSPPTPPDEQSLSGGSVSPIGLGPWFSIWHATSKTVQSSKVTFPPAPKFSSNLLTLLFTTLQLFGNK